MPRRRRPPSSRLLRSSLPIRASRSCTATRRRAVMALKALGQVLELHGAKRSDPVVEVARGYDLGTPLKLLEGHSRCPAPAAGEGSRGTRRALRTAARTMKPEIILTRSSSIAFEVMSRTAWFRHHLAPGCKTGVEPLDDLPEHRGLVALGTLQSPTAATSSWK